MRRLDLSEHVAFQPLSFFQNSALGGGYKSKMYDSEGFGMSTWPQAFCTNSSFYQKPIISCNSFHVDERGISCLPEPFWYIMYLHASFAQTQMCERVHYQRCDGTGME
jgi:hypothetical protein